MSGHEKVYVSTATENTPATEQSKRKVATRSAPRKNPGIRQSGCPYKRLAADVLRVQITVLMKKLEVLTAKKTLIAERLEAYEAENKLREQEEQQKKEEA